MTDLDEVTRARGLLRTLEARRGLAAGRALHPGATPADEAALNDLDRRIGEARTRLELAEAATGHLPGLEDLLHDADADEA